MLDRATDAERNVNFGGNGLAGRADLTVHGKPAGIADGTRGGDLSAQSLRQLPGEFDVLLLFDSTAHGDDDLRLGKVHRLLGFLKDLKRLHAHCAVIDIYADFFYAGGTGAHFRLVAPIGACLKGGKVGRVAGEGDVGGKFPLKHLAGKYQPLSILTIGDAIADQRALQRVGQLGSEVAHLVGVRHQHQPRLSLGDKLLKGGNVSVGGIAVQPGRFNGVNLAQLCGRNLGGSIAGAGAEYGRFHAPSHLSGDGLRRLHRFQRNPIEFLFALLSYNQNSVSHSGEFVRGAQSRLPHAHLLLPERFPGTVIGANASFPEDQHLSFSLYHRRAKDRMTKQEDERRGHGPSQAARSVLERLRSDCNIG